MQVVIRQGATAHAMMPLRATRVRLWSRSVLGQYVRSRIAPADPPRQTVVHMGPPTALTTRPLSPMPMPRSKRQVRRGTAGCSHYEEIPEVPTVVPKQRVRPS